MDDKIRQWLTRGRTIDITTRGRHSGEPRRIEIVFHNIDGILGAIRAEGGAHRGRGLHSGFHA
jgi:hypothetical protein